MIAMALACSPRMVIGDEPTTGLDVMVKAQILQLLEELAREKNMSMILITHDLSVVGETCDQVVVMYAGKIVETGEVERVFKARPSLHPGPAGGLPGYQGEPGPGFLHPGKPPQPAGPPSGMPLS
jgi:peptide/nickel transport system ATP-binding protein